VGTKWANYDRLWSGTKYSWSDQTVSKTGGPNGNGWSWHTLRSGPPSLNKKNPAHRPPQPSSGLLCSSLSHASRRLLPCRPAPLACASPPTLHRRRSPAPPLQRCTGAARGSPRGQQPPPAGSGGSPLAAPVAWSASVPQTLARPGAPRPQSRLRLATSRRPTPTSAPPKKKRATWRQPATAPRRPQPPNRTDQGKSPFSSSTLADFCMSAFSPGGEPMCIPGAEGICDLGKFTF